MVTNDKAATEDKKTPCFPNLSGERGCFEVQYALPRLPASEKSVGGIPSPLSSAEQFARKKSTERLTFVASASRALRTRPRATEFSEVMTAEDLIWATTSSGSSLIDIFSDVSSRVVELN